MAGAIHYTEILNDLSEDSVVITPNRRLSSFLHYLYQTIQLENGRTCWQTPTILPITVWMSECWNNYARRNTTPLPLILNSTQESLLWESILADSEYKNYFLRLTETAKIVKAARGLLVQWQVSADHPLFDSADDYAALKHWVNKFESICQKENWMDNVSIPNMLIPKILGNETQIPNDIVLTGFNDLSPQIISLLDACKKMGTTVKEVKATIKASDINRATAADHDDELYLIARWAKQLHEEDEHASIGCVIPTLDKKRDRVVQIFNEVFNNAESFNISAGNNLAHYPAIHAALQFLNLYKKQISSESFYFILSTPFIAGGETERIKRSVFDSMIRSRNISEFDISAQLKKSDDSKTLSLANSCPILSSRIFKLKALLEDGEKKASYSYWAELFNQLLSALGWPGERILNSEEYQVVDEWLKLLRELKTLDQTNKATTFYQALHILQQMAMNKPFQPKTPQAPVQLLGILEASGLTFDHLWVSGMDDHSWPTQANPNPFIPKSLQRELMMPHAASDRELSYCITMTEQFTYSADHVLFSHARKRDDRILQPSPLIREFNEINKSELQIPSFKSHSTLIHESKNIEIIHDEHGPKHLPDEEIHGGVEIIKNQALCPFKAFAECRLHARDLESPIPGLRAKDRGTIIHEILEKFWQTMKSQQQLYATPLNETNEIIDRIINDTLNSQTNSQYSNTEYISLEKKRLHKLMSDWLEVEKLRESFTVTESEKKSQINLGPLTLNVRIDRIDELNDGRKLIIDYKTGTSYKTGNWFGDRLEEPQLPLYAQLNKDSVAGIAFAQVATGNHCYKGASRHTIDVDGIRPIESIRYTQAESWSDQVDEWGTVLNKLGNDFYTGHAEVNPKDPNQTCQWCSLKPLCRIHEYSEYQDDR